MGGQTVNSNDTEEVIWEMLSWSRALQTLDSSLSKDEADVIALIGKLQAIDEPRPVMKVAQLLFQRIIPANDLIVALRSAEVGQDFQIIVDGDTNTRSAVESLSVQDVFYLWFYIALFEEMEGRCHSSHE